MFIEIVVPWRRKHAKRMAELEEQLKSLQIEKERAEVLEKRDPKRKYLEIKKIEAEILERRVDLTLKVLNSMFPDMTESQKYSYIEQLLEPLETLALTPLTIKMPRNPRQ